MKYDKSLEQVWKWKDSIYNRVKGMAVKKQLEFISKEAKTIAEKSRIRLKKVSGHVVASAPSPRRGKESFFCGRSEL